MKDVTSSPSQALLLRARGWQLPVSHAHKQDRASRGELLRHRLLMQL